MKKMWQRASLCAVLVALGLPSYAAAQTIPAIQGTSVADPAVPVLVAPAPVGSGFFVLNQDFSILQHSLVDSSQNVSCNGPGIFSRTIVSPRTLVADQYNLYMSGPDGGGYNTAVDAMTPQVSCTPVQALDYTGGLATQTVSTNDPQHGLYYMVSAYGGTMVDSLLALTNLNNASVSSTNKFTNATEIALDVNGLYTSIVSDTRSAFGLTAITELKTATSPGNLLIYYPQNTTVYKILGPGGVPLPAVNSFIIPAQTDGGGDLLVLVNQDGLTSSNITNPPQDTAPFTIIDLGQLRPLFLTNPKHNTITLPFVQQINATTAFYAMLGAAYNPIDHRVYAVVAGGTSTTSVVESVISYDTLNPSTPNEQVVADVSNVPFSLGSYPQLALNAASKTMQILTSNPSVVYTVGISGTGNTAVPVPASTFPDSNFQPTYIASNPLQGETYIASASGQVDVLTRPTTLQGGLTLTLSGSDVADTSQPYQVTPLALWPVYDPSLATANLTITVTPVGGTPVVLATGHVSDVGYPGTSFYSYTFPATGQYTIVANAAASALYPAVTSPALNVFVGSAGVYPTVTTLSLPATVAATNGAASLNATVTLSGTTYAPSGQVYIQDSTGAQVGNIQLPKGVITNPLTIPITINQGVQTLTAVYSGDTQNQTSKSSPQSITVGTVAKVTPTFALTLPASVASGASATGNLKFTSTSTTAPTGIVTVYATLSGSTTANQIATVPAGQAFASGGASFTFTAPAAGSYTVFAGYGGDSTYNNVVSPNSTLTITGPQTVTTSGIAAPATATAGTPFNTVVSLSVSGTVTTPPTGNVVLTASQAGGSTTTLGTVTAAQAMAAGGATISAALPTIGIYTLSATYAGDALYSASSKTASITVNGTASPTTLGVSGPSNVLTGVSFVTTLTFKATGTATAPITGNITLTAKGINGSVNDFQLGTISAANALASGSVQITGSIPFGGTYSLSAVYDGDANYTDAVGSVVITVSQLTTSLGLSGSTNQVPGVAFPLTVRLTAQTSQTATPTGNVAITTYVGSTFTTLATVTAAQAMTSGGFQTQVTLPSSGTFTVTAIYSGDSNFNSATATLLVNAASAASLTLRSTVASPVVNTPFTLCVDLASKTSTATPTGSFTLGAVDPNTLSVAYPAVSAAASLSQMACTAPISVSQTGTWVFSATYPGDSNYPALQASLSIIVQPQQTSVKVVGAGTAVALSPYQVVTTLTSPNTTPDGNLTLSATLAGSTTAAITMSLDRNLALSGITSFLTFPSAGTYTVTASFMGLSNTTSSTSPALTVVVAPAPATNFTLTLDDPSVAVGLGGLTLHAPNNRTTVTLTTTGVGPGPVTLSASGSFPGVVVFRDATTMKLITTATPTTAGTKVIVEYDNTTPLASLGMLDVRSHPVPFSLAGGLFGLAFLRFRRSKVRQMRGLYLLGAVVFIVFAARVLAGCGSPPPSYQVNITATPLTASTAAPPQSVVILVTQ